MACRKINNEKKNIKSPIRLNIVSCSPAHFNSKMSICCRDISIDENPISHFDALPKTFRILIGNNRGLLQQFLLAPDDRLTCPLSASKRSASRLLEAETCRNLLARACGKIPLMGIQCLVWGIHRRRRFPVEGKRYIFLNGCTICWIWHYP